MTGFLIKCQPNQLPSNDSSLLPMTADGQGQAACGPDPTVRPVPTCREHLPGLDRAHQMA